MDDRSRADGGRLVRELTGADLAASVALHARNLPTGFFPRLGSGFLRSYHRTFVDSPHAVALGASAHGQLQGVLLAVLAPGPHGAYVLRRCGMALMARGVLALSTRPSLLLLFLRTRVVRYGRGLWRRWSNTPGPSPSAPAAALAVLSHVAVDREVRSAGMGAALVHALHDRAIAAGGQGVVLVTDADGPGPGFYRRLGYVEQDVVVGTDGRPWVRFLSRFG